uniref:Ig-like domain-containing protein n=1 Tax=Parascaris equorum TaxID=6256 RepID=A0A914R7A2_PAREQ
MDPSLVKGFKVKCEAVGDPLPTISWLVDEHPFTDSYNEFTVQDHINDLTTTSEVFVPSRTRSEVFTCIGSNNIGSARASTEVQILGPGNAPTDIAATTDSLGLHVSWNPPSNLNGKIQVDTQLPLKTQIVLLNPAANISGTNRLLVEPGEDIEFKCIVEGRPPPHIFVYWSDGRQRHVWPFFRMLQNL